MRETELNLWVTKTDFSHDILDSCEFGFLRPKEFSSSWRVVKEILNIHRRTSRMRRGR